MANCVCCLRWCIYVLSAITAVMAIAVFTIDQYVHHHNQEKRVEQNSTTSKNIIMAGVMLASAAPGIYHCFSPRLIFIALMVLLSAVYLICRGFWAHEYRPWMVISVILNAIFGCIYFYFAAFRVEREPDESSWKTFTKPSSGLNSSALGSSNPGTSQPMASQEFAPVKTNLPKGGNKNKKKVPRSAIRSNRSNL